ncbi:MAG: site-specific DNA-methyltransferase [Planctomycetales bacterium]|nr:site-specific DNA-methyltransferase [Planctomycetales bacterium]
MPTLNWIGKEAVVDHHRHIPTRLLECDPKLSFGDPDAENLLVEGDNLEALKALLPRYRGQVKCIYIDPPYNTGNENWVYNDNVNDPRIKKWLGQVVGKEAEDLCRHDKWLCMMYPRLALLREFLREDGSIFVSIADDEGHSLKLLLSEVFGATNFVASIIWQKVYSPKNTAQHFSEDHDYILVFAKNKQLWRPKLLPRSEEQNARYENPDNDSRGLWKTSDLAARNYYDKGTYSITCPSGRFIEGPPRGNYWRVSPEKFREMDADNRIWWGVDKNSIPQIKRFLSEVKDGVVPQTLWFYRQVGHTQEAKQELIRLVDFEGSDDVFVTPKPTRLIRRILEIATEKDSIVLDSFAGTGTTGQAVLECNLRDGGNRQCILVEIEPSVAQPITAKRLARATSGKGWVHSEKHLLWEQKLTPTKLGRGDKLLNDANQIAEAEKRKWDSVRLVVEDDHLRLYGELRSERVEGLGSGFRYCKLGRTLLDESGDINGEVPFIDLARYVYLLETGVPVPKRPKKDCPLLGVHQGRAIYLLYNGVLGDRRPAGGNVLTNSVLAGLPLHPEGKGSRVIFGEATRLSESTLARENIVFRQIPYSLRES